ncbi:MAG: aldehyde dehydrogenase family protein [Acidimicrobiales bacterium]
MSGWGAFARRRSRRRGWWRWRAATGAWPARGGTSPRSRSPRRPSSSPRWPPGSTRPSSPARTTSSPPTSCRAPPPGGAAPGPGGRRSPRRRDRAGPGAGRERVEGYIATARAEGAPVRFEVTLPLLVQAAAGYYVAPIVFGDVRPQMTIFREEVSGPVAALSRCGDDDEAVSLANDSPYGLRAAIGTREEVSGPLAARLEVEMVFVNNCTRRTFIGSPCGGVKASGYGREYAPETLHEFVRAKNVRFPSGRGETPGWPPR